MPRPSECLRRADAETHPPGLRVEGIGGWGAWGADAVVGVMGSRREWRRAAAGGGGRRRPKTGRNGPGGRTSSRNYLLERLDHRGGTLKLRSPFAELPMPLTGGGRAFRLLDISGSAHAGTRRKVLSTTIFHRESGSSGLRHGLLLPDRLRLVGSVDRSGVFGVETRGRHGMGVRMSA